MTFFLILYAGPQEGCDVRHSGFRVTGAAGLQDWNPSRGKQAGAGHPALLVVTLTEETRRERDTCTPIFVTALFIIARSWKQPRCPSADEWIRKLWYIYTMEYYSAIKKNTFESVLMTWMKLEPIIQS